MEKNTFYFAPAYPKNPPKSSGMTAVCVRRATEEFPFLHDTSVTLLGGRLFTAWYQCTAGEIAGITQIAGTWSDDGGRTWSEPEVVVGDSAYHYVPAVFYETADGIFALVTRMTAHDRPVNVLELTYSDGKWIPHRDHDIRFLFNTTPRQLSDGTWISGGRVSPKAGELPQIPAAAVRDIAGNWTIQRFDGPWNDGNFVLYCPETAILVSENDRRAIVRSDHGQPYTFRCAEGRWTFTGETDLPVHSAKMYAGTLSDGREYLFYNERTRQNDRSRLVMALREDASGCSDGFTKLYLIADGYDDQLRCGPYWHYPCAYEQKGMLYVSCTANGPDNVRDAVVYRIPIDSL